MSREGGDDAKSGAAYPMFDDVWQLLLEPDNVSNCPENCTPVFKGPKQLVLSLATPQWEPLEDIWSRCEGRWFVDASGLYHMITKANASAYLSAAAMSRVMKVKVVDGKACVRAKEDDESTPMAFTFDVFRDLSVLSQVGMAVDELLSEKKTFKIGSIMKILEYNVYRLPNEERGVLRASDVGRVKALLSEHPAFRRKDSLVLGVRDFVPGTFPKEGLLEQCMFVFVNYDPGCQGLFLKELEEYLQMYGVDAGVDEINMVLRRDPRVYDYFGLLGVKPSVPFEKPKERKLHTRKNRSLQELVLWALKRADRPMSLIEIFEQIEDMTFVCEWKKHKVSENTIDRLTSVVFASPYVLSDGQNNFYAINENRECDFLGGLYCHALQLLGHDRHINPAEVRVVGDNGMCLFASRMRRGGQLVWEDSSDDVSEDTVSDVEDEKEAPKSEENRRRQETEPRPSGQREITSVPMGMEFSQEACRKIAIARHKWNTFIANKESVRLYTKNDFDSAINEPGTQWVLTHQETLDKVLTEAWNNLQQRCPSQKVFSVHQITQELYGREFSTIHNTIEKLTLTADQKSLHAVREALLRSSHFHQYGADWVFENRTREFKDGLQCYESFTQILISSIHALKEQHPEQNWFLISDVKRLSAGKYFVRRCGCVPVLVAFEDRMKVVTNDVRFFSHVPFLASGRYCTLFSYIAPRDYTNLIMPYSPWKLNPTQVQEFNKIESPPFSDDDLKLVNQHYRSSPWGFPIPVALPQRLDNTENEPEMADDEEPKSSDGVFDIPQEKPAERQPSERNKEKQSASVEESAWPVRRTTGSWTLEPIVQLSTLEPDVLEFPNPVKIPGI